MQQLNYNHLYYFHTVATTGSIAEAARGLRLTQPTISQQIKQLEATLDATLFERLPGGGLRLTEAGREVFEHTEVMFRAGDRLLQAFRPGSSRVARVVDIGVVSAVSKVLAVDFFVRLFDTPDLNPRIQTGSHDRLANSLLNAELDILLTDAMFEDPEDRGVEGTVVSEPSLVAVAPPALAAKVETFPEDLVRVPYVHYAPTARHRWRLDRYFEGHGVEPQIAGEVEEIALMVALAERGRCAAIVPKTSAAAALEAGRVVAFGEVPDIDTRVWAIYLDRPASEVVRDAIEVLTGGPSGPQGTS